MRWLGIAIAVLVALAGCSGSDGPDTDLTTTDVLVEAEPTPEAFDPTDSDQLAGVATNPARIEAGDCFNEYVYRDRSDFLQQITTLVRCGGPHDREAYFETEYPGGEDEPAPPEETLKRWAEQECLDEFEAFVGREYVLSRLEIGAIVPTFEGWTDDGDRNVICYVYPDDTAYRLRDSVANSGL